MKTFAEVIEALGDEIPAGLAIAKGRVAVWKHRGRIPPEFWFPLAALPAAKAKGITVELLQGIDAERKKAEAA